METRWQQAESGSTDYSRKESQETGRILLNQLREYNERRELQVPSTKEYGTIGYTTLQGIKHKLYANQPQHWNHWQVKWLCCYTASVRGQDILCSKWAVSSWSWCDESRKCTDLSDLTRVTLWRLDDWIRAFTKWQVFWGVPRVQWSAPTKSDQEMEPATCEPSTGSTNPKAHWSTRGAKGSPSGLTEALQ